MWIGRSEQTKKYLFESCHSQSLSNFCFMLLSFSVCRLAITISSVIIKIIFMPCRKLIGANNPHYNGHMPISTVDYSYRGDPYRSNANADFEMS